MALSFRENLELLVSGHSPQWVPFSLDIGGIQGLTEPVLERFRRETGALSPAEHFGYDFRIASLRRTFGGDAPAAFHGEVPGGATYDEWGIGHLAGGGDGTVDRMYPPLACAETLRDIESYPSPLVGGPEDREAIEGYRRGGYPVFGYAGSIYEWSWWLRGMERFMTDLILEPAMAGAIVEKVAAHTLELASRSAALGIDVLCFYDDAGMQTGLQISPALWRRFIKPAWKKVLDTLRESRPGARFFLHSCGNIAPILPDIVELGFHILHPVQPECMDFGDAVRRFGDRIVLCATVSSQRTLPFGSPAEVRGEVRRLLGTAGAKRRTLLCPSNRVQPETPWDNVVALAEEARSGRPV